MVQMKRCLLLLTGVCLVKGEKDLGECSINAARTVDEMFDSAMFIWAAVERCQNKGEVVQCEVDVASAVESVNGIANAFIESLEGCEGLYVDECGKEIGHFTEASAGAAAATGEIVNKCTDKGDKVQGEDDEFMGKVGTCVLDISYSMRSLFNGVHRILEAKQKCKDEPEECAPEAVEIVAAFASLGEYVGGALGHCGKDGTGIGRLPNAVDVECATEITGLVAKAGALAAAATGMSMSCKATSARLYQFGLPVHVPASVSSVTPFLVALLPIAASMSFIMGSRLAKHHRKEGQGDDIENYEAEALIQVDSDME